MNEAECKSNKIAQSSNVFYFGPHNFQQISQPGVSAAFCTHCGKVVRLDIPEKS